MASVIDARRPARARSSDDLEQVQRAPRVAVGRPRQRLERVGLDAHRVARRLVLQRAAQHLAHVVERQRAQHVDARPRQQRAVDLERRVLGGRADEAHRAVLDVRQERVLLRLVEAVHLVEEQHRLAAALALAATCACSTAARTSFTPAITADSATNSASQVRATSRASVVLPVPGGPHSSIECRLRPSSRRRSGLPGASRC